MMKPKKFYKKYIMFFSAWMRSHADKNGKSAFMQLFFVKFNRLCIGVLACILCALMQSLKIQTTERKIS
ncbi:MAG: hypothetical protein LBP54_05460 [Campylobacteraceae bacterium]|nr:hypothetical protein [Campylobacteraceae bacterium]